MERYQRSGLQSPNVQASQGLSVATSEVASNFVSLSDRLESFSKQSFQLAGEQAAAKATQDAADDAYNKKPFHKESVHTVYGKAYNNARNATFTAEGEMNLSAQMNQLSIDHQNDPIAFHKASQAAIDTISENSPTPEIKAALNITGKKLQNHTFGKLQVAFDGKVKQHQAQTYNRFIDEQVAQIAILATNGDTATIKTKTDNMRNSTIAMIEAGVIPPEAANGLETKVQFETNKAIQSKKMQDSIDAGDLNKAKVFLDNYGKTIDPGFTIGEHENINEKLTKMYNSAVKTSNAKLKEMKEQSEILVSEAEQVFKYGQTPDNIDQVRASLPFVSEKKQRSFLVQEKAFKIENKYSNLSISEYEAKLVELGNEKGSDKIDVEVMKKMEANLKERKKLAEQDPVLLAQKENIHNDDNIILQRGMKPEDMVAGIAQRVAQIKVNQESYGIGATNIFTESEAKEFSDYLSSPDVPVEDKLSAISVIEQGAGDKSKYAYSQLVKKGASTVGFAGSLVSKGETQTAQNILVGEMLLKEVPKIVDYELLTEKISSAIGNAVVDPGAGELKAIYDAAAALFAYKANEKGKMGADLTNADAKEIVNNLLGGIGSHNDQKYFLPKNYNQDQVDDYIDELTIDQVPDFSGMNKEYGIQIIKKGQLVSTGENKYRVRFKGQYLYTSDGKPYIMEFK